MATAKKKATDTVLKAPPEPLFEVSQLRETCTKTLGVEQSTFDGAFFSYPPDAMFTLSQAKDHIAKWLKKPLKL